MYFVARVIRTYTILQMGEDNLVQRYLEEEFVMPLPPQGFIHSTRFYETPPIFQDLC